MIERISTVPDRGKKRRAHHNCQVSQRTSVMDTNHAPNVETRKTKPDSRSMSRPKGMIAATPIATRDRKRVVRNAIPTKSVMTQWKTYERLQGGRDQR